MSLSLYPLLSLSLTVSPSGSNHLFFLIHTLCPLGLSVCLSLSLPSLSLPRPLYLTWRPHRGCRRGGSWARRIQSSPWPRLRWFPKHSRMNNWALAGSISSRIFSRIKGRRTISRGYKPLGRYKFLFSRYFSLYSGQKSANYWYSLKNIFSSIFEDRNFLY